MKFEVDLHPDGLHRRVRAEAHHSDLQRLYHLVYAAISGVASHSLCFHSQLDYDLSEIVINVIPFLRLQFSMIGFALSTTRGSR